MARRLILAAIAGVAALAALAPLAFPPKSESSAARMPSAPHPSQAVAARPFEVDVPARYADRDQPRAATPAPLLLALHGYSANGESLASGHWGLSTIARERGIFVAHPDGTLDASGRRFWNATDACCDFDSAGIDDVAYLTSVIDDVAARYPIDPKRVWIAGISNGGFMGHRLACDRADRIAAVVSFGGAGWKDGARCTPSAPVSILEVHVLGDPIVAYDGGASVLDEKGKPYPSIADTVTETAAKDGCTGALVALAPRTALDAENPAAVTAVSGWTGCPPGIDVEWWAMPGMKHIPRVTRTWGAEVLAWLERHPKR